MKIKKGDKVVVAGKPDYIEKGFYHTGATGVVVSRHGDICHVCFTGGTYRGMGDFKGPTADRVECDPFDLRSTVWAVDVDLLELVEREGYDDGRRSLFRIPKG